MPSQPTRRGKKADTGKWARGGDDQATLLPQRPVIPPTACIQAYEAQLVYGQDDLARQLATPAEDLPESSRARGRGLIQWTGDAEDGRRIWADRHDILHLLSSFPEYTHTTSISPPASPTSSWDSLPSDAEDTFFLSGTEDLEDYAREKKRRWMEVMREERMKERAKEEKELEAIEAGRGPSWGGDDETPPEPVLTLMSHTAISLSKSPNPHLLEMRILANHSNDDRFAFLKGRWKDAWEKAKEGVRKSRQNDPKKKEKEEKAMGALVGGYESSEDETEDGDGPPPPPRDLMDSLPPPPPDDDNTAQSPPGPLDVDPPRKPQGSPRPKSSEDEAEKQRIRRLRAEEWKRNRTAKGSIT